MRELLEKINLNKVVKYTLFMFLKNSPSWNLSFRNTGIKIEILSNPEQHFLGYKSIAANETGFKKMIKKGIFCILSLEPDPRLTVQSPDIRAGHSRQFRRIITDHFHRIDSGNLCTKHIDFRFHHKKLTGGYIGIGDPCFFSVQVNTHQIIV